MRLDQLVGRPLAEIGGKAHQLARLHAAGLPVPPLFVVPAAEFRTALDLAGLTPLAREVAADPTRAPELERALLARDPPAALAAQWTRSAQALGGRLVVRSSGAEEDGAHRSFAGAHLTLVDVSVAELPRAIVRCWASLYGERAIAYRRGDGPAPGSLAVIVQDLVVPECSGVLFTVNPRNGNWSEMVVEAVWGLGEGIASGHFAPHSFVVRRPRPMPGPLGRLAARVAVQVVRSDLPELTEQFVPGPSGEERVAVPEAQRSRPTLDGHGLRVLCRLGLKVEAALGEPVDVEWVRAPNGRFSIVQARPITTGTSPRRGDVLWTRRFLGERWQEPATPLGWSLLLPVLEHLIAFPETQERLLGGGPPLRLVHGRPYVNATVFRHLAFKLPGAPPLGFALELVPPDEEQAWRTRFAVAPDLGVYGSILRTTFGERRWQRFGWNPLTNPDDWARYEQRLLDALPGLRAPPRSTADAVAKVEAHLEWIREYAGIHTCSLLFANLAWQMLQANLEAALPERAAALMEALAVCPPGNLTLEVNAALHRLAQLATDADLERLDAPSGPFARELAAFLDRYGHRSEASWEFMSPRWRTRPSLLAPLLRAQRGSSGDAPEHRAAEREAQYEQAMAELGRTLGPARLLPLRTLVRYTRRYLLLRENQRFRFEALTDSLRQALLWLGAQVLADPEDVAFLTWDELQEGGDVTALVARRKAERAADLAEDPPVFLVGDDPGPPAGPSSRLEGLGISAGRIRGKVRVVRSIAEGTALEAGEILVARALDPAWTPLFHLAAGVVLEMGGMLSHGAVVAREYKLPAVVNVDRATEQLRDGEEVTVDGNRGVVWVHR